MDKLFFKKVNQFWLAIAFTLGIIISISIYFFAIVDVIGWYEARVEASKIVKVCKDRGIYNKKYPYAEIVYWVRKWSDDFDIDRKLVYSIITIESEWCPTARNVNYNQSVDRGCLQVNTIWDDVILSDNMLATIFNGDTNRIRRVEEFIYDIRHNTFIGCFILREKLSLNKNFRTAISRYNGSGYAAELYADKVMSVYYSICKAY